MARYQETTAYLIHQRNYKDSSLILEFFTKDFGMIHILAKGIKKNKRLIMELHYFCLLKIQFFGKSQLKTLSALNAQETRQYDTLLLQTSALYLNELLRYSLIENETAIELFKHYQRALQQLGEYKLTPILRNFERTILKHNGFELNLDSFRNPHAWISISETKGLSIANKSSNALCQVLDLQKFINHETLDRVMQKRINKFMIEAINLSLSNRKIFSRELLKLITER